MKELDFIIDSEPKYTLHECLELLNTNILNTMYKKYQEINYIKKTSKPSKKYIIKQLEEAIISFFKDTLDMFITVREFEILDSALEGNISDYYLNFLCAGIMFRFKDNIFIIPNELLDMYKDYLKTNKKHDLDSEKIKRVSYGYLLMNGIIPINIFNDIIINKYHYSLTKKEIKDLVDFDIYKNKYFTMESVSNKKFLDTLIKIKNSYLKENCNYQILDEDKLNDYVNLVNEFIFKLNDILGDDLTNSLIGLIFIDNLDLDNFFKENNIPKTKQEKIKRIVNHYIKDIRIWLYNGMLSSEVSN